MDSQVRPLADPTSVVGRRIGAWFLDLAGFIAFSTAILFATGGMSWQVDSFPSNAAAVAACEDFQDQANGQICSVTQDQVIFLEVEGISDNRVWLVHTVLYIVIQGLTGGSLGKLAVGLRVVDEQGRRIGIVKSGLRTFLWIADAITCMLPIVGGVLMVSTKGHRRVGDIVAGTYVVDRSDVGRPIASLVAGYAAPPPPGPWSGAGTGAGAWGAPPGGATEVPATPLAPTDDGPHWDEARDTYIQYDRNRSEWLQWDARRNQWKPIER